MGKHVFSHVFLMTYIDCFFEILTVNGDHTSNLIALKFQGAYMGFK